MDSGTAYLNEPTQELRKERSTYRYFRLSVTLKGLLSALEIVGGILVIALPGQDILRLADLFATLWLTIFPFHLMAAIAAYGQSLAKELVQTTVFVSFYLLSRGLIKLLLVIALLKNKLWAYPASLIVLALFMLYQIYQMIVSFSSIVLFITLFDLVVVYFIWKEYQIVKAHHGQQIA